MRLCKKLTQFDFLQIVEYFLSSLRLHDQLLPYSQVLGKVLRFFRNFTKLSLCTIEYPQPAYHYKHDIFLVF